MARVLITDTYLSDIAGAIRGKLGVQTTYTPPQMAGAIASIPTGGAPVLQSKTVTENGTVTPDAGYDGLSEVVVNVSEGGGYGNARVLTPVTVNANNGCLNYANWQPDNSGNYYCDAYEVIAGHHYVFAWGPRGTSDMYTYANFFTINPCLGNVTVEGIQANSSTSNGEYVVKPTSTYVAPSNGFIVIQKTARGVNNAIAYCIDLG